MLNNGNNLSGKVGVETIETKLMAKFKGFWFKENVYHVTKLY